ncbi:DUF2946 family protein [Rhodopila sp.]|uniref:DUF2946 family protein n=1 Tax=Rhodopila sp. TaxID=2480087 RepID=UPI002BAA4E99|nr:DUF2946 family protein [Rhodopila sp.]HVZ07295.1 DUF2946 family protein [Rhodopila sp.]
MIRTWSRTAGLLAALFALTVQLALGAVVPRIDPIKAAWDIGSAPICHGDDGGSPSTPDSHHHLADCLVCPLCAALHAPAPPLPDVATRLPAPPPELALRPELPPPATAGPLLGWTPNQARAPPVFS